MKHYMVVYGVTVTVMILLDMLWIGAIARDFYKSRIPNLEFHAVPAVIFYLLYGLGILVFVSGRPDVSWQYSFIYGALFGLFAYATYDLTNLATLQGWSGVLALVDMAWGACITGAAATAGVLVANYFKV